MQDAQPQLAGRANACLDPPMDGTEDQSFANFFIPYRAPALRYAHMIAIFRVFKHDKSMCILLAQMETF